MYNTTKNYRTFSLIRGFNRAIFWKLDFEIEIAVLIQKVQNQSDNFSESLGDPRLTGTAMTTWPLDWISK